MRVVMQLKHCRHRRLIHYEKLVALTYKQCVHLRKLRDNNMAKSMGRSPSMNTLSASTSSIFGVSRRVDFTTTRGRVRPHFLAKALMKKSVSLPSLKQKKCVKCGKTYPNSTALHRHMKIHNCQTHFQCEDCGKRMVVCRDILFHSFTHLGNQGPHSCTCGRTFTTKAILDEHIHHHANGRAPFECLCGKKFRQQFIVKTDFTESEHASDIGKRWGTITLTHLSADLPKGEGFNHKHTQKKMAGGHCQTLPPLKAVRVNRKSHKKLRQTVPKKAGRSASTIPRTDVGPTQIRQAVVSSNVLPLRRTGGGYYRKDSSRKNASN
jgi:hypothetical protein